MKERGKIAKERKKKKQKGWRRGRRKSKKKRLTNSKAENDARKNFYEQKIMCDVLEKVFFFFFGT